MGFQNLWKEINHSLSKTANFSVCLENETIILWEKMRGYLQVVFTFKTARFIQWFVKEMCPDVKNSYIFSKFMEKGGHKS